MTQIVLKFDNVLAEHLAADRLYYRSTFWWKADKVIAVLLFAIGLAGLLVSGIRSLAIVGFPLSVIEWFNLLSIRPLQIRYFFKRNPKFLETYQITFSDTDIHFKTQTIDSTISWSYYYRILANDIVILLIYGKRMYSVIPRRAFSDESQYATFMTLLQRHILGKIDA